MNVAFLPSLAREPGQQTDVCVTGPAGSVEPHSIACNGPAGPQGCCSLLAASGLPVPDGAGVDSSPAWTYNVITYWTKGQA